MGTKNSPGKFDCYGNAMPDEPMFILLARDPRFYRYVSQWANDREEAIRCGERPESDMAMVHEARQCAALGETWRKENNGSWRHPATQGDGE